MNTSQLSKIIKIISVAFVLFVNLIIAGLALSSTQQVSSFTTTQSSNIAASSIYDDEFDGPTLNSNWYWYNEDPSHWSLIDSPGNLRITTTNGDLFNPCGFTARNVLLQQGPPDNFEIETRVSFNPTQNFQQAGLIIMEDPSTYIKVTMAWNSAQYDGRGIEIVFMRDGEINQRTRFSADLSQPFYLKISKTNTAFTGYYSQDGQQYNEIDTIVTSDIIDPQIGVIAINSCFYNPSEIPADFDYFRVIGEEISVTWEETFSYTDGTVPETIESYKTGGSVTELDVRDGKLEGRIDTPSYGNYARIWWRPVGFAFSGDEAITLEYEGLEQTGYNAGNWYHRIQIVPNDATLGTEWPYPRIAIENQGRASEDIFVHGVGSNGNKTRLASDVYAPSDGLHTYRLELNHVSGTYQSGSMRFYRDGELQFSNDDITAYLDDEVTIRFYIRGDDPYGATNTWDDVSIQPRDTEDMYAISGQVQDSSANPISDVSISTGTSGSATTDASGVYTITGLVTDTYTITPTKSGWTFTPDTRTVSVPPDATGQDFTGTATGEPTVSTGMPALSPDDPLHKVILKGRVDPQGGSIQAWFEWGTNPTLLNHRSTGTQTISSSSMTMTSAISIPLGVKHYYRIASPDRAGKIVDFTILLGDPKAVPNPNWSLYDRLIESYADQYQIPVTTLKAIMAQESSLNESAFRYEPLNAKLAPQLLPYVLPDHAPSESAYPREYWRNAPWKDDTPMVRLPIEITMGALWEGYSDQISMSRPGSKNWEKRAQWRITASYGLGQLMYVYHGDKISWDKPEAFYDPYSSVEATARNLTTCEGDFSDFPLEGASQSVLQHNWGPMPCSYGSIAALRSACQGQWCERADLWQGDLPAYLVKVANWLPDVQPTLVRGVDTGAILSPTVDGATQAEAVPRSSVEMGETELDRLIADLKGTGQSQLAVLYGTNNGSGIEGVLRVFADAEGNSLEWESQPIPGVTSIGAIYTQTLSVEEAPLIVASWGVGAHGTIAYFFHWQEEQFQGILIEEDGATYEGVFADASITVDMESLSVVQRSSEEPLAVTLMNTYTWQDDQAAFTFDSQEIVGPIPFRLYLPLVVNSGQ